MGWRLGAGGREDKGIAAAAPSTSSLQPPAPSLLSAPSPLRVVAGALFQNDRVLIAQRPAGKPMAGWWEFPGGKVNAGEASYDALVRELREELGVEVHAAHELVKYSHTYPERTVHLELWHVTRYSGTARSLDQQALQWVAVGELDRVGLLEGDGPMIEALKALGWRLEAGGLG